MKNTEDNSTPTYGPIRSGETLGEIVEKLDYENLSKSEIMDVIFRDNESSFLNNNINQIKAGEVIKLPSNVPLKLISETGDSNND